jgi:hypothetical protein
VAVGTAIDRPPGDAKKRVTQATLLSDELVRRLISVGQVDIVVGVPTLNHADTIATTLDIVDEGLMQYFPRARTVVIGADGGSNDGTPEIVADATAAAMTARSSGLRTRHRIGASYRGVPGRAGALRVIFTAADLLQAQAVAICDPDATGFAPEWIGALLQPIASRSIDVVAGAYLRHPLEALLVTQLIRPLMRAAYGRHLDQPVLGVFACSRRFAAGCLAEGVWDRSPIREGIGVWLAGMAVAGDYQPAQVPLGRFTPPRGPGLTLQTVFGPLIGALFETLDTHASSWLQNSAASAPVLTLGEISSADLDAPAMDASGLGATFFRDVRDLQPILEQIVAPDTLASLLAAAVDDGTGAVRFDNETWVATVYDFAAAHHHAVIDRTHIVQALMPLYLGRAASFIGEHANSRITDAEQDLERLSQHFERQRPYLIERWHRTR